MKTFKILTRYASYKNREGIIKEYTFPILKLSLSDSDFSSFAFKIDNDFTISVDSLEIDMYREESPETIYISVPLYISEDCNGKYHVSTQSYLSIKRDVDIY